ncbi:MAG TPA: glycosyltransferase [Pyrinomonadaceae bacterium]|nr:glycosyltransferase [Pyrinomonadaceae bacterium]
MTTRNHRILCIGETWHGSDARAAFAALRRLGNSIQVIDENNYVPTHWKTTTGRVVRKILKPLFVKELMSDSLRLIKSFQPDMLFVFKGSWVHPNLIGFCRSASIPVLNYYPDVSFLAHGPNIPKALPLYSHVFNTKAYGVDDMKAQLGVTNITFLEPGFDPELHQPVKLTDEEQALYGCDVSFIGTWSPKKEATLATLIEALPNLKLKVWGCQWEKSGSRSLANFIMGDEITGDAYTKAIRASSICLGLLSEAGKGSSSGDLITARTFQIPACGTFMMHERNPEVLRYFADGTDAAFFSTPKELIEQVQFYLAHDNERERVAANGRDRSVRDDYTIDGRMKVVLRWLDHYRDGSNGN